MVLERGLLGGNDGGTMQETPPFLKYAGAIPVARPAGIIWCCRIPTSLNGALCECLTLVLVVGLDSVARVAADVTPALLVRVSC